MLIDWFTVIAQAINFLILVALLRKFLYHPVLDAIDARDKKVAAELADADAKRAQAQQEKDEFVRKNQEFDAARADLMTKAAADADAERKRRLDLIGKEADASEARQRDSLLRDQDHLIDSLIQRTRAEVFAISRKTLTDLASTGLEAQITEVFIGRLGALDDSERAKMAAALATPGQVVTIRSAYEVSPADRTKLEQAIQKLSNVLPSIHYETAEEIVGGIELAANGWKLSWSIGDYLDSLQSGITDLVDQKTKPIEDREPVAK